MTRTVVAAYPRPPRAHASRIHRVRVGGVAVFAEHRAGVSYARFSMTGPATVAVEVADPIADHAVFPEERIGHVTATGKVLGFDLAAPTSVVVWIDQLEPLFLLPDPPEADARVSGSDGVIDVLDHGADPTGRVLATTALQAAIDRAAGLAGGGTVLLPAGVFRTGTLEIKSHVTLYLAPGAILQGSSDPRDYPIDPGRQESASDASLPPDVRYWGRTMTFSRLLLVDHATDVRITGRGTIDGGGAALRSREGIAPNLLRVRASSHVVISDVLFRDAAAWSIHLLASQDVVVRNVKIINDRATLNTDGVDIDMSADVAIEGSFVYTKDDAVCVKATGNSGLAGEPRHIVVAHNLVSSRDAALKVGTESEAAEFTDIIFEDDYVFDSSRAMSVVVRDGARYERLTFRSIRVGPHVDHLIEQVIGVRAPRADLGTIRDLTFEGITAPAYGKPASNATWYTQFRPHAVSPAGPVHVFEGADEAHQVQGLRLKDVVINGKPIRDAGAARRVAGLSIGPYVRDVTIESSTSRP